MDEFAFRLFNAIDQVINLMHIERSECVKVQLCSVLSHAFAVIANTAEPRISESSFSRHGTQQQRETGARIANNEGPRNTQPYNQQTRPAATGLTQTPHWQTVHCTNEYTTMLPSTRVLGSQQQGPSRKKRYSPKFRKQQAQQRQQQLNWAKCGILEEVWSTSGGSVLTTVTAVEHFDGTATMDNLDNLSVLTCKETSNTNCGDSISPGDSASCVALMNCSEGGSECALSSPNSHTSTQCQKKLKARKYWDSVWKTNVQTNFTEEALGRKAIMREEQQSCEYLHQVVEHIKQLQQDKCNIGMNG